MTTVKLMGIRAYQVFAADGTYLGIFKVEDHWNDMWELESVDNPQHSIIVDEPIGPNKEIFTGNFGGPADVKVVKAAPDVALRLKLGQDEA